jgi:hypothetical protein
MKNKMKNFIKKIDGLTASLIFLAIVMALFMIGGIMKMADNISKATSETNSKEYENMYRKSRICLTYSDKFWRRDVDFIDGKCYYKGKEVEIK